MDTINAIIILLIILILFIIYIKEKPTRRNIFAEYNYFDANGTTPIHKEALEEYAKCSYLGNSSSSYSEIMGSDKIIVRTSNIIKSRLMENAERYFEQNSVFTEKKNEPPVGSLNEYNVIFNSCASEGNNYILRCLSDSYLLKNKYSGRVPHFIISAIEHKTTLSCAKELETMGRATLTIINPDEKTLAINPDDIEKAIQENTILISVMHANNETGIYNPIYEIGKIAAKYNIFFHSDIVQTFGKNIIPVVKNNLDAVTISMHKLYGPVGVGALVISPKLCKYICSSQISGTQFGGRRGGTINIAGIASSGIAMNITFNNRKQKNRKLSSLKEYLKRGLSNMLMTENYSKFAGKDDKWTGSELQEGMRVVYISTDDSMPNTLLFSIVRLGNYNIENENKRFCNVKLKKFLMKKGYIVSIGSACNTKLSGPSHVLRAINAPFLIRSGTIRVSMTDYTTEKQVDGLLDAIFDGISEQIKRFE